MSINSITHNWIYQKDTQELSDGNSLKMQPCLSSTTFEITGDGTNKVIFEGRISSDSNFYPIIGINLETFDMFSETTDKNIVCQCSLEGLVEFRVRVNEYTDGSVTVKGTVVN